MSQQVEIRRKLILLINGGMRDKSEIYTKVTQMLKVPRPTVRRAARDLILDLEYKINILKGVRIYETPVVGKIN